MPGRMAPGEAHVFASLVPWLIYSVWILGSIGMLVVGTKVHLSRKFWEGHGCGLTLGQASVQTIRRGIFLGCWATDYWPFFYFYAACTPRKSAGVLSRQLGMVPFLDLEFCGGPSRVGSGCAGLQPGRWSGGVSGFSSSLAAFCSSFLQLMAFEVVSWPFPKSGGFLGSLMLSGCGDINRRHCLSRVAWLPGWEFLVARGPRSRGARGRSLQAGLWIPRCVGSIRNHRLPLRSLYYVIPLPRGRPISKFISVDGWAFWAAFLCLTLKWGLTITCIQAIPIWPLPQKKVPSSLRPIQGMDVDFGLLPKLSALRCRREAVETATGRGTSKDVAPGRFVLGLVSSILYCS